MLPTMVACSVQWNVMALAFRSTTPREVEPGATSPKSPEPSSNTRWCIVPSLLRKVTVSPALARAGLGENEVFPDEPTIETDTVVVGELGVGGDNVGGVGAAAVAEGAVGDGVAPPPPQLHNANAPRTATAAPGDIECRMQVFLRRSRKASDVPRQSAINPTVMAHAAYAR